MIQDIRSAINSQVAKIGQKHVIAPPMLDGYIPKEVYGKNSKTVILENDPMKIQKIKQ